MMGIINIDLETSYTICLISGALYGSDLFCKLKVDQNECV